MTLNLKALSLALFAALVLGAFGAQAAVANQDAVVLTTAEEADLTGTSTGKDVFSAGSAEVECHGTYTGTLSQAVSTTVKMTPSYSECTFGGSNITVDVNGCDYLFHGNTDGNGHAAVDLTCNHEGSIVITAPLCTITFSDTHSGSEATVNQGLRGVAYTNQDVGKSTEDFEVDATVTGITYVGSGFGCLVAGISGTRHDGSYDAEVTVKAYEDNGEHKEDEQLPVAVTTEE